MPGRVTVKSRRSSLASETIIIRGDRVVAVLPEGDPLRYLLQLPRDRLEDIKSKLGPVLKQQPRVKEVLEAIIEYKEGASET